MSTNLPVVVTGAVLDPPALPIPTQADTDRDLIALWVARSASPHTQRNYRRQAARFLAFVNRPLALVRLGDVQAYLAALEGQAPATTPRPRSSPCSPSPRRSATYVLTSARCSRRPRSRTRSPSASWV